MWLFCSARSYSWRHLWASFYGIKPHITLFDDVVKLYKSGNKAAMNRYKQLNKDRFIDSMAYKKRVTVSIETLLLEVRLTNICISVLTS
jgi:hypothetical protein